MSNYSHILCACMVERNCHPDSFISKGFYLPQKKNCLFKINDAVLHHVLYKNKSKNYKPLKHYKI